MKDSVDIKKFGKNFVLNFLKFLVLDRMRVKAKMTNPQIWSNFCSRRLKRYQKSRLEKIKSFFHSVLLQILGLIICSKLLYLLGAMLSRIIASWKRKNPNYCVQNYYTYAEKKLLVVVLHRVLGKTGQLFPFNGCLLNFLWIRCQCKCLRHSTIFLPKWRSKFFVSIS